MSVKDITLNEAYNIMEKAGYDLAEDAIRNKFTRWINEGRHVLIFTNEDLSHYMVGFVMAMPWSADEEIPPHGPDSSLGLGWRYITSHVVRAPAATQADVEAYNEALAAGDPIKVDLSAKVLADKIYTKQLAELQDGSAP